MCFSLRAVARGYKRQVFVQVEYDFFIMAEHFSWSAFKAFLLCNVLEIFVVIEICRIEGILFLFERVADYLTEADAGYIRDVVESCLVLKLWGLSDGPDESVLGNSLMNLLYAFSHLISCGTDVRLKSN